MTLRLDGDLIEKGIEIYWKTLAKARGMRCFTTPHYTYVMAENRRGPERIFNVHFDGPDLENCLEEAVEAIRARRIPGSFLLTAGSTPADLPTLLQEKGLQIDTSGLCMAMQLPEADVYQDLPEEGAVREVDNLSQLREWAGIVNTALFGGEVFSLPQFEDLYRLDSTHLYLVTLNGAPASTCMTIAAEGTATLEMVATLESFRKKGLATAAIRKALGDLREEGIETVSLRAEPDGINVYKKIGFVEVCPRTVASFPRG